MGGDLLGWKGATLSVFSSVSTGVVGTHESGD